MNVPPGARIPLLYRDAGAGTAARLESHRELILRLARLTSIEIADAVAPGAVQIVLDEATFVLPLADVIDLSKERARLEKEIGRIAGDIDKLDKKLANEKFLAKAPADVIEEQRERMAEAERSRAKLHEALERIAT
jgi:valyl-tRNA synthetase